MHTELLIDTIKEAVDYANTFPRLLEKVYQLSENDTFKEIIKAYSDTCQSINEGVKAAAPNDYNQDLLHRDPRERYAHEQKRAELSLRHRMDILGYELQQSQSQWLIEPVSLSVGRDTLLKTLTETFSEEQVAGLLKQAVIVGLGGVGKSHSALYYANTHRSRYTFGAILNGVSKETLYASYKKIGTDLGLSLPDKADEVIDVMKEYFESQVMEGWLLLVDNGDEPDVIKEFLPKRGGHLLITSRSHAWDHDTLIDISTLDRAASIDLLQAISEIRDTDGADELASRLGDLPIALETAAKYMRENKQTVPHFKAYLEKLRQFPTLQSADSSPWHLTMKRIEEENPEALHVLQAISFLAPEDIPISDDFSQKVFNI